MNDMSNENVNMASTPIDTRPDEMLTQLAHEAAEHQRVWGIVTALTEQLVLSRKEVDLLDGLVEQQFRSPYNPREDEQNARIHRLEQKIVKQRKTLKNLEECRLFERETEQLLVIALENISMAPSKASALVRANDALVDHDNRKGPRPQEADGS